MSQPINKSSSGRYRRIIADHRRRMWKNILSDAKKRRERAVYERDEHRDSADYMQAEIDGLDADIPEISVILERALNEVALAEKQERGSK